MPAPPLVCVIVACFNADQHLAATLESVRAQEFQAWECVVVDDGSTDSSAAIAARFTSDPRFRVVTQANGGVSHARNTGIAAASDGVELLAFLDADDVWTPSALDRLVARLNAAPDAVGAYGTADYMDEHGHPLRSGDHAALQADRRRMGRADLVAVAPGEPSRFATLIVSGTIWPSGVGLHRRSAVERAGRFDPQITRAEDWELYLRMSRFGDFVVLTEQVVWYRRHQHNATAAAQARLMAESMLRVRWLVESSGQFPSALRREAARVWRRLAGRWIVWALLAAVRAARDGRRSDAADAAGAALRFARRLRRPVRPDARLVDDTVRYVVDRSAGAGSPLP